MYISIPHHSAILLYRKGLDILKAKKLYGDQQPQKSWRQLSYDARPVLEAVQPSSLFYVHPDPKNSQCTKIALIE